ncbi:phosphotransferase [Microbacterium deminutum]|uniref:Aminoglycoside phosphotransferase domain-containing protein n=1 Tax=Microbacterium deminutum TaxID=344164 RepID=A0ABN2QXD1_9MICO
MPDKPRAEVTIDEGLVRMLLAEQAGGIYSAALPVAHEADGWDCSVWRIGDAWAARLPRRSAAATLVINEQQVLPAIAARVEPTGIRVPAPVICGAPAAGFRWPWSVVAWIEGSRGIDIPRAERSAWAEPLAAALGALHAAAPDDYPPNPFRGVPLAARSDAVAQRLAHLKADATLSEEDSDAAVSVWAKGLAAAPWTGPPVWIHGDLHPANLVAQGPRLAGIIDFGDVTAGDPAYDLAVAWLAFDGEGRRRFIAATAGRYDDATWLRARAWSAAVALMLLAHSDDEPAYAALGGEALAETV